MYRFPFPLRRPLPEDQSQGGSRSFGITLSTTSILVLEPNFQRKRLVLQNDDATSVIYISKVDPAVVNASPRLNVNGGSYSFPDSAGGVWLGPIYAVAAVGTPVLIVSEDI